MQVFQFCLVEEVEHPVIDDGCLSEKFVIERALPLFRRHCAVFFRRRFLYVGEEQGFFSRVDASELLFCEFVLELRRAEIVEIPVALLDFLKEGAIAGAKFLQGLFEEEILVEGEGEAECHEAHHGKSGHDGEVFSDGFRACSGGEHADHIIGYAWRP